MARNLQKRAVVTVAAVVLAISMGTMLVGGVLSRPASAEPKCPSPRSANGLARCREFSGWDYNEPMDAPTRPFAG